MRGKGGYGLFLVTAPDVPIVPWDAGEEGAHLTFERGLSLAPEKETIIWGWWGLLDPGDDPRPWHGLRHIKPEP